MVLSADASSIPVNGEARKVAASWNLDADNTGGNQCKAFGVGGIIRQPGRLRISWQDDQTLKMEFDAGTQTRVLNFDRTKTASGEKTWQGFSLRWWYQDPFDSVWHDAALRTAMFQTLKLSTLTVLLAVPLGTAFAIGIDRWHGRPATTANFFMLFSFVMPEIILGVSLFLLFTNLFENAVRLGTTAQFLGLVTFQMSYPVIIVRARLLSIGPEYEEAAMDLGAPPRQSLGRVLLPLLGPAILASAALVFADSVDDFVTVRYLSGPASSEPLSVKIYSAARASPTPAVNAAATIMLISSSNASFR